MKRTVDAQRCLDVRWLQRKGFLKPGVFVTVSWTRNGEPDGDVVARAREGRIILMYRVCNNQQPQWQNIEQRVFLVWTRCNYGGRRPWFICPGMIRGRSCGRRVAVLIGAGPYFLCRHCHNLTYQSRNENEADRLLRKARKIRERLGADINHTVPILEKPKGMHWKTFSRLVLQAKRASTKSLLLMALPFSPNKRRILDDLENL
jgi:hypothetical protein